MDEHQFITHHDLQPDAVVPQCLDNQFVSDRVFHYMMERGVNYLDSEVHRLREEEIRNEFIRSLVYASQVVVNRAYLRNNANVYGYFSPGSADLDAAAALVRDKAIVPYLFKENSLLENVAFDVRTDGDKAIAALLEALDGPPVCVRLGSDSQSNEKATRLLAQNFHAFLTRLKHYDEEQRNALTAELFNDRQILDDADVWQLFNKQLDAIADFAYHQSGPVQRNEIYRRFIVAPDGDVAMGEFRAPDRDNPFVFELKKLVDLAYNTTLPDLLKRYTFTPSTLPTRAALQDQLTLPRGADWRSCVPGADVLEWIRRHFLARMQSAMTLPHMSRLTMADVVELRRFDEWEAFRAAQTDVLENPLGLVDRLPRFSTAFDNFQAALSRWYARKYADPQTTERYANFVTFMLQVGGRYICATLVPPGDHLLHVATDAIVNRAITVMPERVKGVVAKLMVGVYNVGKGKLDRERSYTLELMRANDEILRSDLVDLAERLTNRNDVPVSLGHFADQGKNETT